MTARLVTSCGDCPFLRTGDAPTQDAHCGVDVDIEAWPLIATEDEPTAWASTRPDWCPLDVGPVTVDVERLNAKEKP